MARSLLPIGMLISLVSVAWLALVSVRKRYLSRMAVRQFVRRPGETLLVIAGSILGTALVTGSFITGDSLIASFTDKAYERLGEVDVTVQLADPRAAQSAERNLDDIRQLDLVDGAVLADTATGVVRSVRDPSATEPRAFVFSLDTAELDDFGVEAQTVGGPTPSPDAAIVTRELADDLDVRAGDTVELLFGAAEREFRVDRVVEGDGFASFQNGHALYVAPNVLDDLAAGAGTSDQVTRELWVSNAGDSRTGVDLTFPVKSELRRIIGVDENVEVIEVKKTFVEQSEQAAESIGQLFLVISTFAVIAGVLLLVNIFVMLATERRSELGMLRAVGMKRADLVRGFALEGSLYAGSAALIGMAVGIAVGIAIVFIADRIFSQIDFGAGELNVDLVLEIPTLIAGLLVGYAISIVTIFVTSFRVSRVNIIAAIRDLEVTRAQRRPLRSWLGGPVLIVAGGALTATGMTAADAIPALIGPALIGFGVWLLLDKIVPQRLLVSVVGLGVLAWGIAAPVLIDLFENEEEFVFVVQGLVTTFAAVMVITVNQEMIAAFVRYVSALGNLRRGSALAARLATTYPVARRFRTGMTLVMYALIVFTLVLITTFSYVTQLNVEAVVREESAGFDIVATTNPATPPDAGDIEDSEGVDFAYGIMRAPSILRTLDGDEDGDRVYGVDADFIRLTGYPLSEFDPAYENDEQVWQAVAQDPSLVVVDGFYAEQTAGPEGLITLEIGDRIEMVDPISGRVEERRVVGFNDAGITLEGSFVSADAIERQYRAAGQNAWLITSEPGANPDLVSERLNADNVEFGLEARTIDSLVRDFMAVNLQFFGLLRGYLALGLVVGIVGLGVIMVRAVRERRREIGVLRALGFRAQTVRRAFMSEAGIVASEGIALGVLLGVVTARSVISSSFGDTFDVDFAVPWGSVGILAALTFVFSVLVAVLPARAAAKIRPAVALRIAD